MKHIIPITIIILFFNTVSAQQANVEIPTHYIKEARYAIEYPAYIDSSLFANYLNWNLQPDSLVIAGKPAKGYTIEIWYIVSKEGKISFAKSRDNQKNELTNFVLQKFMSCPYQWSPAYRNGRPVNSYLKLKIVF